jgi:hypothetical protein
MRLRPIALTQARTIPLLRLQPFGSIIRALRHVPNRPLDLQCSRVLMTYLEKLSKQ